MKKTTVRVLCPNGIHISPAGVMAKLLAPLSARVEIGRGDARANAADVDEVLGLALREGEDIWIQAEGADADKATEIVCSVMREGVKMLAHLQAASGRGEAAEKKDAPPAAAIASGVRIGRIRQIADDFDLWFASYIKGTPMEEARRFGEAVKAFGARMEKASRAAAGAGDTRAQLILDGYKMMADAPGFHAEVGRAINDGAAAPEAVLRAKETLAKTMLLQERAGDQREVGRSIARILLGVPEASDAGDGTPLILVGEEISPEMMARFPGKRLAGIVEASDSPSGHAAILARMRGIPALLDYADVKSLPDGATAIIDGEKKTIVVNPSGEELRRARGMMEKEQAEARRLLEESGPVRTSDGTEITLRANVGSVEEIEAAQKIGAEGVGLFRSEFLFLGRASLPSEDEQAGVYAQSAKACGEKPCVIRTLDAGGDKEIPALHLPKEANPFLGVRAIRVSLAQPELLSTQLRAVLRAAKDGAVALLLPMIVSVEEIRAVRERLEHERRALFGEKGDAPRVPVGVMIETPAAALTAAALACHADTKTTFRDSQGRIQGTVTTDRYGKTTYRDAMGRVQGSQTTDRYGKTTYRDAMGRVQGSETTDRFGKTTYRDAQGRVIGTKK